ncbi:MAG: SGNH/GDSL hydrolase family protein [Limisphaerales bacterium]
MGAGTVQTEIVNNLVHGGIQTEGGQAQIHDNLAKRLDGYFVDPIDGNLALLATATEAIDHAVALNSVPYDFRRLPRKQGSDLGALEFGSTKGEWIDEMKKVHARFKGEPGTFAHIGDSITFSGAFWSPLSTRPKNMTEVAEANYQSMRKHMKPECLNQKGPSFGNQGSMTIRWAQENLTNWLASLNPEVVVLMFGSNDVGQMESEEYAQKTRDVVMKCLANGTIVLLTTPPPQSARLEKTLDFAGAIRRIAMDTKVPLIDYCDEIMERRPFDWDGASAEFSAEPSETYEVPTLISRDGVHPSNPRIFINDFSEHALEHSGYGLRNYLTMTAYADVIRHTLR